MDESATPLPTTAAAVITELGLPNLNANDQKLLDVVAATNAFVMERHPAPTGADGQYRADHRLGAARLAAGLYRNANRPGISDNGLGATNDQAFRRATDVLIEQLLGIGRFAPPAVG